MADTHKRTDVATTQNQTHASRACSLVSITPYTIRISNMRSLKGVCGSTHGPCRNPVCGMWPIFL